MKLKKWMKKNGWSSVALAERLGVTHMTIYYWTTEKAHYKVIPTPSHMRAIRELTGNEVNPDDFY